MTMREQLTDADDNALRGAISKAAHGAMVTKYVIIAETIDPETGQGDALQPVR